MRKLILCSALFIYAQSVICQQTTLNQFNIERQKISKKGLKILSGYSIANIIYGSIASSNTTGSNKYFHKINVLWNGVTLGIVGIGTIFSKKEKVLSYGGSLKKQSEIEKLFLFNAGLDVAYIAGGAYLKEQSKISTNNPSRLNGYGESVIFQGIVLLLFDGIMYSIHNTHGKILNALVDKMTVQTTENGIGVVIKL
ncbi:MAG: hypothetical protein WKF85_09440 [Chitinophagaceae bacterium]